ncbi:hypothetical protein SELMODRAFT_413954 [Selaginella moellendorffii]|uniref:Cyanovirin-N domain-containing protein n=1 Tax=Selaginella moellendorffii TaxID=88036 RepID=D8RR59_SELML|nr:uncharacterized protein LOC9642593 [Selaginella moellendorffii]EFJ25187.1 hypothetical protein SELMODRAFT_413954 [Selaginella moellendorffii]|eukprot:XP_002973527.1 uncharacterized protein LOC9642593 [Selaginella moellendorffii]
MASTCDILIVFSMLIVVSQASCHFSSSCTEIRFYGNIMSANCRTDAGKVVRSSIDVNECVGVDYSGKLDCSSNFVPRCHNVAFNGITMAATCKDGYGHEVFSNRALDECIGNDDGHLICC